MIEPLKEHYVMAGGFYHSPPEDLALRGLGMHGALASAVLYSLPTAGPAGIYACGGGFGPRHDGVRRACTGNCPLPQSSAQESPGFSRGEWSMRPIPILSG